MTNRLKLLFSTGLGAAAMYYFDPARGRYRRALVRDQIVHGSHRARHGVTVVGRDTRNRIVGLAATLRSLLDQGQPDDVVLVERVRSCLGRAVSHPHAIKVDATDGVVTLSGPLLREELPLLMDCALGVRGVRDLRNRLELHDEPGNSPALQGNQRPRPGARSAFMQSNWSPTARAAGGLAGVMAVTHGFGQRSLAGTIVGSAGLLLLTRAATNMEMRRLLGIGMPRYAVDVKKTIRIDAPVEKVFGLWDNFENFPKFMTHVRHIRRIQTGDKRDRWRWTVTGPTGMEIEFDAVLTAREENRLLAWRTEGTPLVQHSGRVHFQDNPDGSTTADVNMQYNPVVGAVGHAIAWLFQADPKHQMNDDLMRMKSYLETGKPPRDAAEPGQDMPEPARERAQDRTIPETGGVPGPAEQRQAH